MASMAEQRQPDARQSSRHFLMLQVPCGRFGYELRQSLIAAGHRCSRVVLNGGDLLNGLFGRPRLYRKSFADWPAWLVALVQRKGITDLICYGDCRAYHRVAIDTLRPLGVKIHVLEEGYLRPNWITCESDGVNGHSALTRIDLDRIGPLKPQQLDETKLHASNLRYAFAGIFYYAATLFLTPLFPRYQSHRDLDILGEWTLWLQRLLALPLRRSRTERALRAIERAAKPVHLVLLQLNGDSQIKVHSSFQSVRHFVEYCMAEFAASGAQDSLLVFKNHPLDNGVIDLNRVIRDETARYGLEGRIFFVETGKLVPLLERTVSATAINSTACHQALLRGIPTLVLGRAVFNHPQIVARMRLADFFRLRPCSSRADYDKLISLMRQTCQFNGGYYSAEGRRVLLPSLTTALIEGMPSPQSYEVADEAEAATKQAS